MTAETHLPPQTTTDLNQAVWNVSTNTEDISMFLKSKLKKSIINIKLRTVCTRLMNKNINRNIKLLRWFSSHLLCFLWWVRPPHKPRPSPQKPRPMWLWTSRTQKQTSRWALPSSSSLRKRRRGAGQMEGKDDQFISCSSFFSFSLSPCLFVCLFGWLFICLFVCLLLDSAATAQAVRVMTSLMMSAVKK